jgi:hypothetical protein
MTESELTIRVGVGVDGRMGMIQDSLSGSKGKI